MKSSSGLSQAHVKSVQSSGNFLPQAEVSDYPPDAALVTQTLACSRSHAGISASSSIVQLSTILNITVSQSIVYCCPATVSQFWLRQFSEHLLLFNRL